MRILFCRSNPIAPDPRVEKEAATLLEFGHEVHAIAWDRDASLPSSEEKSGIWIHRLPIHAEFGHGIGNLPALLKWQVNLTLWLLKKQASYDIIHACDFDTILPALLCKLLFGKKVIYDIFDFYADHLRATPRLIKTFIRWFDLFVIGLADAVILADETRQEQISGAHPRKLVIIYNSPKDFKADVKDADYDGFLKIVYVGLLQVERGLQELLEILSRHTEWHLDLAGFGGDKEHIYTIAKSLPNVTWHGRVSYEQALHISAQANLFIATYDPLILNHKYASPNKVFEAMMLAKPIVVARGTNMDRIINNWNCGLMVNYGNLDDLEQALCKLSDNPHLRKKLGENGRRAYELEFSWEQMQKRLYELYENLNSRGKTWQKSF